MNEKTAFPLCWPERRNRLPKERRKTNGHFKASFAKARDNCVVEIKRLNGDNIIISTNIRLKRDGQPEAVDFGKVIPDPGVAVYFKRNGKELCFACDCWSHVQDNMYAISLTIQALRGIARWGTGDMMEAAFTGFMALPAPGQSSGASWWTTLGVPINASKADVLSAYRGLVKKFHPDNTTTGDREKFQQIQEAWQQCENILK